MSEYGNGAKLKVQSRVADIIGVKRQENVSVKQEVADNRATNVSANAFYKVIFNPNLTPDEKQKEVAKQLATIGTKEENRERVAALEEIKEYLQLQREKMASNIIAVTDTDVMAQLQDTYNSMNNGLLEFNEAMKPITDIIEAMATVRAEGKTASVFAEIRNEKIDEKAIDVERNTISKKFQDTKNLLDQLNIDIALLQEEKGWFGFGGITKEAQQTINVKQIEIEKAKTVLADLEQELNTLSAVPETIEDNSDYAEAKKTIRKMLDLSAEGHKENQKKTVEKALAFVNTSKTSLGNIKSHLNGLNGQIDNLTDANHTMISAYAILGEGVKDAEKEIINKRNEISTEIEGESMIAKMTRDENLRVIDEHTTLLSSSAADTELSFADLSSQTSRIRTMKDSNKNQLDKVQKMATNGIAGTADRLSVVLQALGAAALAESSEIARETLVSMNDATNEIALRETMRVAHGTQEINSDIQKAMEDLSAYGEVAKVATSITTDSMSEMRKNLEELKNVATGLQEDLKKQGAVASLASQEVEQAGSVSVTPNVADNPFKL